jgi:nitroreductase
MNVDEAIHIRRSIRSYLPNPIPTQILRRILEAGRLAPSASNRMPWKFVVVTDPHKRRAIASSCSFGPFLSVSPVVIVGCGDREGSPKWFLVDTAIALQNMVLAATGEGVGSCWIGSFRQETIRELLKIPDQFQVVALLALGYAKDGVDLTRLAARVIRPTKALEQVTASEEFDQPLLLANHSQNQDSIAVR